MGGVGGDRYVMLLYVPLGEGGGGGRGMQINITYLYPPPHPNNIFTSEELGDQCKIEFAGLPLVSSGK